MSEPRQATFSSPFNQDAPVAPGTVLIPRDRLLSFADECEASGRRWKAAAIRTRCAGYWSGEAVPVSAALLRLWGIEL